MTFADVIVMASRKLRRRWLRSVFTVLSVSMGMVVLVASVSLLEGIRRTIVRGAEAWISSDQVVQVRHHRPDRNKKFSDEEIETIAGLSRVRQVIAPCFVDFARVEINEGNVIGRLEGVSESIVKKFLRADARFTYDGPIVPIVVGKLNLLYQYNPPTRRLERIGRPVESFIGREFDIVLGDIGGGIDELIALAQAGDDPAASRPALDRHKRVLRARLSAFFDLATLEARKCYRCRVVGICPGRKALIPLNAAEEMNRWLEQRVTKALIDPDLPLQVVAEYLPGNRGGTYLYVLTEDPKDALAVNYAIDEIGYDGRSLAKSIEEQLGKFRIAVAVFSGIGLLIYVMTSLTIANTILRSVADSTREIGVFRAVGATRQQIRRIYLFEAGLLSGLGGVCGVGLGNLAAWSVSRWVLHTAQAMVQEEKFGGLRISVREADLLPASLYRFEWQADVLFLLATVVIGLVAGYVPARKAAHVDPVRALRAE